MSLKLNGLTVTNAINGSVTGNAATATTATTASTATTATTANALNTSNNYQVNSIGVGIAGSGTAGRIGTNENGVRSWTITPTGGRLVFNSGDGNGSANFGFPVTASTFVGAGTGLTGTAEGLIAGMANELNDDNTYFVTSLTATSQIGTKSTNIGANLERGDATVTTLRFDSDNFRFYAGGTGGIGETLRITEGGLVGIGTSIPNAKLDSYFSSNAITFNYLATNLNNNSPIPTYTFDVTNGIAETRSIKAGIGYERHLTNGRGTLHIYNRSTDDTSNISGTRSSAGDIKMSIDNAGNVGIGLVVPNAKLDVSGVIRGDAGANYPHSFTNTDAGNTHWTNRGERVLTSNGTNWTGDGRDPIIALVTSGNSNSLNIANSIGLTLHNESTTDNTFSPAILFSNKSNSNSYNTAYAAIIGRKTGQGVDANWSAGELHFYTMPVGAYIQNVPSMLINSAGNVGIGITGPSHKLHVYGADIRQMIQSSADNSNIIIGQWDGSTNRIESSVRKLFLTSYANGIGFGINGSENMTLNTSGNLGIGTTSPVALLDLYKSSAINGPMISIRSDFTAAGKFAMIRFGDQSQTTLYQKGAFIYEGVAGSARGRMHIALENTDTNVSVALTDARLTVQSDGNVGIGTTVPAAKLHVNSTVAGATLLRTDGTSGTLFSVVDDLSDSLMSVNNSAGLPVLEVFADDRVVAGQYGKNDLVVINNKVGIGANNPANKLTVSGSTSIGESYINTSAPTNGLIVQGNVGIGITSFTCKLAILGEVQISSNSAYTTHLNYGDSGVNFITMANGGYTDFRGSANNITTMRVYGNGIVGIGTTSPTAKLVVMGDDVQNYAKSSVPTAIVADDDVEFLIGSTDNFAGEEITLRMGSVHTSYYTYGAYVKAIQGAGVDYYKLAFGTSNAAAATTKMTIDNVGNVGIGSTSPAAKLDVNGTAIIQYEEGQNQYSFRGANRAINDWDSSGLTNNPTINSYADGSWFIDSGVVDNWDRGILSKRRFRRVEGLTLEYESYTQDNSVGVGGIYVMIGFVGGDSVNFSYNQTPSNLTYQANGTLEVYTNSSNSGNDYSFDTRNAWWRFKTVLKGAGALHYVYRNNKWNLIKETSTNNQNDYEYLRVIVTLYRQRIYFRDVKVYVAQQSFRGSNYIDNVVGNLDVSGSIYTSAKLVQKSTTQSLTGTTGCTIDLANGVVHILSLANGTNITASTYNSRDNNPSVNTLMLVFKYAGTATVTFTDVIWANGVAPTLTQTNGFADVFMLTSYKGGATPAVWIGTVVSQGLVSTNL